MRTRISSHIRWARFLFLLAAIGFLTWIIMSLVEESIHQDGIPVMLMAMLICGLLYYFFDLAKAVEYDSDFMYVKGKSGEEKIPLKDIYKIKLTMIQINKRNLWKISYYDERRVEKSVRILPRFMHVRFDEFKDRVRIANKNVKIKNWSHSFDLDQ